MRTLLIYQTVAVQIFAEIISRIIQILKIRKIKDPRNIHVSAIRQGYVCKNTSVRASYTALNATCIYAHPILVDIHVFCECM